MATGETSTFEVIRLETAQRGRATLLDAVETSIPGEFELYFTHDTPVDAIVAGQGARVDEIGTLMGAPVLTVTRTGGDADPFQMVLDGEEVDIRPSASRLSCFEGRNVALATRNGERASLVLTWLGYHAKAHGMDGALILNRGAPGEDPEFLRELEAGLAEHAPGCQVAVVEIGTPLGRQDLPHEAHPFCVPGAPGKDRMHIPDPDPWHAPMAGMIYYEWARAACLGRARAVVNIDVYDLLYDAKAQGVKDSLFDRVANSEQGYLMLEGHHCYPWRARDGDKPLFADHACVQFDAPGPRKRWCIAPGKLKAGATWRTIRIGGMTHDAARDQHFFRFMALRHPTESVSRIVPKSSLIEHAPLLEMLGRHFDYKPVLPPVEKLARKTNGRRAIITTMKNEGPFILEWIAYHQAIGVDDFLVYTNDCTDGTDTLLDLLQEKGVLQHRDNPFKGTDLKPQHAALAAGEEEPIIAEAEWVVCMDVDEFITIKCGDGTLDALFAEVPDANLISMTWRLFGNCDVHEFDPGFITKQFLRCAPELARKPHQAWGFKTFYKNTGIFKKLGVHRPKGLKPQLWEEINWVNGSGKPLPREMYRNAWRSTTETYGYDLVQLNHYAVRSAESFLVKRDRGRVNHVDRDQGLAYWFRMNNNAEEELSIQRMIPRLQEAFDALMADEDIRREHTACVAAHRAKIDELKATPNYAKFYEELTGPRLEKLSRMHSFFGANVFLQGPGSVPDEVVARDLEPPFFFTVADGETEH
ncbi:glycosyltransferase family 2 protein [Aliiroseovarius marinus]|uniref:glycosyltransferase family 2 protein n=1 Tax=Aliiroseovarius marinus TaxID=2500159 RepID=UPI003D7EBBE6